MVLQVLSVDAKVAVPIAKPDVIVPAAKALGQVVAYAVEKGVVVPKPKKSSVLSSSVPVVDTAHAELMQDS